MIAWKAVTIGAQICQSFSEMNFSHSAAQQKILAKYLRMKKNFNILAKYLPMNIKEAAYVRHSCHTHKFFLKYT